MLAAQGGVVGFQSAKESKYNRDKFEVGELTIPPDSVQVLRGRM